MDFRAIRKLFSDAFTQWNEDKPFQLAAALSYYTLFSLAPLLVIAIAVAGLVFGQEAAQHQIVGAIQGIVGRQSAEAIQEMIKNAGARGSGITATLLGVGTLLIGAGGVVGQLQDSLNTIWGVAPKPGLGILGLLRARFFSLAMVLGLGFLLLVSLLVSAALTAALQFVGAGGESVLWQGVEFVVSLGVITLLIALIYKVLPDVHMAWRDVLIGAAVTALLFTLGKFLIGLYLGSSATESAYGAAGSLVVVLVWVYYSALIFFFGAEFTQVYANTYGAGVTPDEHAVAVTDNVKPGTEAPTPGKVGAKPPATLH
jgi:membrane protein